MLYQLLDIIEPEDLGFIFFSFLSMTDIIRLNRISTQFKRLATSYVANVTNHTYYAASPYSLVKIGTWKHVSYGICFKIVENISPATLLHAFRYKYNQNSSNDTFYIFNTEAESINFLQNASLLFREISNEDGGDCTWANTYQIMTAPIYKVRVRKSEDDASIQQEFTKEVQDKPRLVNVAHLLPYSASIRYCLWGGENPLKTIRNDVNLHKNEEMHTALINSCAMM